MKVSVQKRSKWTQSRLQWAFSHEDILPALMSQCNWTYFCKIISSRFFESWMHIFVCKATVRKTLVNQWIQMQRNFCFTVNPLLLVVISMFQLRFQESELPLLPSCKNKFKKMNRLYLSFAPSPLHRLSESDAFLKTI